MLVQLSSLECPIEPAPPPTPAPGPCVLGPGSAPTGQLRSWSGHPSENHEWLLHGLALGISSSSYGQYSGYCFSHALRTPTPTCQPTTFQFPSEPSSFLLPPEPLGLENYLVFSAPKEKEDFDRRNEGVTAFLLWRIRSKSSGLKLFTKRCSTFKLVSST